MGLHADFGQQAADRRTGAALALLRPPFAWNGYANSIPNTGPGGNGRFLTPLELLDRFAALVRRRASTTTATSARWRERPLAGNLRGDLDRQELAVCPHCRNVIERPLYNSRQPSTYEGLLRIVVPPFSAEA